MAERPKEKRFVLYTGHGPPNHSPFFNETAETEEEALAKSSPYLSVKPRPVWYERVSETDEDPPVERKARPDLWP